MADLHPIDEDPDATLKAGPGTNTVPDGHVPRVAAKVRRFGDFYAQAAALYVCGLLMALFPGCAMLLFGVVSGACFIVPGFRYRKRVSNRPAGPPR